MRRQHGQSASGKLSRREYFLCWANAFHITAILGHEDVNTSQIYTVATDSGLRRVMESLAEKKETDAEVPTQEERPPKLAAVKR